MNLLSLKTLLVAAALFTGASAWAQGTERALLAENYESATEVSDWTAWNASMLSLATGDATYGKYVKVDIGSTAANRGAYKTITPAFTFGSGYTTSDMSTAGYNVEFDLKIKSGNTKDRSKSDFVVPTAAFTTTTGTYSGSTYVFSLSQPTRDDNGASTTWYINDIENSTGSTVALDNSKWYHVKLVCSASTVDYTITDKSNSSNVATGSKSFASLPSIWGLWTAVGRGGGFTYIDNINVYDYSSADNVSMPSIDVTYNGTNRTVTIIGGTSTLGNTVNTYYTTDGSTPTESSNLYTTPLDIDTDCTITAVTISSSGAVSSPRSEVVTVGKLTLATPAISATGFTNTTGLSVNNPTFNFTCNNSEIMGTPTASLSYTFTPDGGTESAATAGTSFTPTQYGTLKVIASAEGYNSSEKSLVVSSLYTISFTGRDYTTAATTDITEESNWGASAAVTWTGWESGLTASLLKVAMSDDQRFRIQNNNTISLVSGWGWVRGDQNTYNYQSRYATEGNFVALKENSSKGTDASAITYQTVYCSSGTGVATSTVTITAPGGYAVQQLYHYSAVPATQNVEVTSAGYATYVNNDYDLDFSETSLKAYTVKVNTKGVATLTEQSKVKAGTPVLLIGATEEVPVTTGAAAIAAEDNDLVAGTGAVVATTDGEYTNMILNKKGGSTGFYFAAGQTVAEGRAYLHIASSLAPEAVGAPMLIVFANDATGISSVGINSVDADKAVFNLQGQRIQQPKKGLYIVGGKKIVVK